MTSDQADARAEGLLLGPVPYDDPEGMRMRTEAIAEICDMKLDVLRLEGGEQLVIV